MIIGLGFLGYIIYGISPYWLKQTDREIQLLNELNEKSLGAVLSDTLDWADSIEFNASEIFLSTSKKDSVVKVHFDSLARSGAKGRFVTLKGKSVSVNFFSQLKFNLKREVNIYQKYSPSEAELRLNEFIRITELTHHFIYDTAKYYFLRPERSSVPVRSLFRRDTYIYFPAYDLNEIYKQHTSSAILISGMALEWPLIVGLITLYGILVVAVLSIPKIGLIHEDVKATRLLKKSSKIDGFAKLIEYDINRLRLYTSQLYNRSTLMLLSGISVAVVGVLIFLVLIPDPKDFDRTADNYWKIYLVHAVRPALLLVFIEFIAIFLLRQYRALINDFKYFHSIGLSRFDNALITDIITNEKLEEKQKTRLINDINKRSERLNIIALNDRLGNGKTEKVDNQISQISELIKVIRGK